MASHRLPRIVKTDAFDYHQIKAAADLGYLICIWGFSSVGRASDLHSEGQEFESPSLQRLHLRL